MSSEDVWSFRRHCTNRRCRWWVLQLNGRHVATYPDYDHAWQHMIDQTRRPTP